MNLKDLLESLKSQEKNFDNLFSAVYSKKESLLRNDYELLEEAIRNEQAVLNSIDAEERKRKQIILAIAEQSNITLKKPAVDELLTHCAKFHATELKKLEESRDRLKQKALSIVNLNSQLGLLLEVSRSMLKETIILLLGKDNKGIVNKRV